MFLTTRYSIKYICIHAFMRCTTRNSHDEANDCFTVAAASTADKAV